MVTMTTELNARAAMASKPQYVEASPTRRQRADVTARHL
jgi:hypothetical protein